MNTDNAVSRKHRLSVVGTSGFLQHAELLVLGHCKWSWTVQHVCSRVRLSFLHLQARQRLDEFQASPACLVGVQLTCLSVADFHQKPRALNLSLLLFVAFVGALGRLRVQSGMRVADEGVRTLSLLFCCSPYILQAVSV